MASGDFRDLPNEQLLIKHYRIKHLVLLKSQNIMNIKEVFLLWFKSFLIIVCQVKALFKTKNQQKNYTNQKSENIKNWKYTHLSKIIFWVADLADNLFFIIIFSKYSSVFLSKDKKAITITNAVQKIIDESNRKPYKIWVDKGSKFYKRSMKS